MLCNNMRETLHIKMLCCHDSKQTSVGCTYVRFDTAHNDSRECSEMWCNVLLSKRNNVAHQRKEKG